MEFEDDNVDDNDGHNECYDPKVTILSNLKIR